MELFSIPTGHFKLDGGAMFGVVPKSIWNRLNPADEHNMCSWAMRCLLVKSGSRLILIDNGIGDKQDEKFFSYYFLHGTDTLDLSLQRNGFSRDDITDVFLTHLHFDHCGGSIKRKKDGQGFEPAFKRACYWVHSKQWAHAMNPNPREKASFLKENLLPIEQSGQMRFMDQQADFPPGFQFLTVDGHTESMALPLIETAREKILFMADLIPSAAHIPLPYVMAYDIRPLLTMHEKQELLSRAASENWVLFYEHDPIIECSRVVPTERGFKSMHGTALTEIL